ncbi:hypothetical protein BGZ57DRAFT_852667 [Hyaloscypha finlandica]|nr:hypothetical protein BGZ57DRAFT_852667 [Hyaloscypha finlandica]
MTSTTSVSSPSFLRDIPDIPKILKIVQSALYIQKRKPKIILFTKSGFNESPQGAIKRKKRSDDNENKDKSDERTSKKINHGTNGMAGGVLDESKDKNVKPAPAGRETKKHHRRPKVCGGLTPWGDYGMLADMNDLYPEQRRLKWDNSDVPELDLGEPLDELNFWEESWIEANEEKKKVRDERERKRKRQQRYGGLKATGRKRAYKKRAEAISRREKGKFVDLEHQGDKCEV